MRRLLIALSLFAVQPAVHAQIGVEIGLPGVSIGINLPRYPELVLVPGSPVYYAPRANSNYFFYDGLYWVYRDDNWYSSDWYNGPRQSIGPAEVPLFVLRVPVRYYRQPPAYFRGWRADAPPRWGAHWGRDWSEQHRGWNDRKAHVMPRPAPLPTYQRHYRGDRYPNAGAQQQEIRNDHYRYQPREAVTREHFARPERPAPRGEAPNRPDIRQPPRGTQQPQAENNRASQREQRPALQDRRPDALPERNRQNAAQGTPEREQNNGRDRHNDERGQDRRQP